MISKFQQLVIAALYYWIPIYRARQSLESIVEEMTAILRCLTKYYVEESIKLSCVVLISRLGSFEGGEFSREGESGSI